MVHKFAIIVMTTLIVPACFGRLGDIAQNKVTATPPDPQAEFWNQGSPIDGLWVLQANQDEYTTTKNGKELFCPSFKRPFEVVVHHRKIINASTKAIVMVATDGSFEFESPLTHYPSSQPGDKVRVSGIFEPTGLAGSGTLFFDTKIYRSTGPGCEASFVLKRNPRRIAARTITPGDNQLVKLSGIDRNCKPVKIDAELVVEPEHGSIQRIESTEALDATKIGAAKELKCESGTKKISRLLYRPNHNYRGPDIAIYDLHTGFVFSHYLYLPIMVE